MFRFHTGSIKSNLDNPSGADVVCFDSILVRLKDMRMTSIGFIPIEVSIPYWFD